MNVVTLRRTIRLTLLVIWGSIMGWLVYNTRARGFDAAVMQSDARVSVTETKEGLMFAPDPDTGRVALLFYPGSMVETEAYAPMARAAAEAGFKAVIVDVPLLATWFNQPREAVFDRGAAFLAGDPDRKWVAGGHSLGGKFALAFAQRNAPSVDGLFLVATTHPREENLTGLAMPVTKVYGSADGLASVEEIEQYAGNLPAHTRYVPIEGANHAQFAWYGRQLGDRKAAITRVEQQAALESALLTMLASVEPPR